MKQIMLSIHPPYVKEILTGKKKIEIRKNKPKHLPCRVFIYCTRGYEECKCVDWGHIGRDNHLIRTVDKDFGISYSIGYYGYRIDGKVVGSFMLRRVEEFTIEQLIENTELQDCIRIDGRIGVLSVKQYLKNRKFGYIWYIEDLEIFEKEKDLLEYGCKKAPQNYYIVGEEKLVIPGKYCIYDEYKDKYLGGMFTLCNTCRDVWVKNTEKARVFDDYESALNKLQEIGLVKCYVKELEI